MSSTATRACTLSVVGSALLASMLLAFAMAGYPGGSALDPAARGFDMVDNYLCDLLGRVTRGGGEPNPVSVVARAGMLAFAVALTAFFVLAPGLFLERRALGRVVRAAGVASTCALAAASLLPSERVGGLHPALVLCAVACTLVASVGVTLGLAAHPSTRRWAILGAGALACAAAVEALFLAKLALDLEAVAAVVPALQKVAVAVFVVWMIGVATAVERGSGYSSPAPAPGSTP
jgi:hypothetical protein